MFRRNSDEKIDTYSLNSILRTGSKLFNIGYFMAIIAIIILVSYLLKEWRILPFIGEFLVVISPLFIGLIVAWLFDPLVRVLNNKGIPRLLGCIISYVIIIGLIVLISYLFIPSFINQIREFVSNLPTILDEVTSFIVRFINKFDSNGFIDTEEIKSNIISSINKYGTNVTSNLPKYALSIGKSLLSGGLNIALGLMVGFYLLYDFNKINDFIIKYLPVSWRDNYRELVHRINTSLRSYVQGVLIVMVLVFLTQSIGLTLAGLSSPLVFALFCAVTDIIPYFGPYIGGVPAVIVGFTISPITGVCTLISIVVVQLLENNFYQPLIMGHTMRLHPVTIMIGLLVFQHFFGILGMIVATPCIAIIKVLLSFINEKLGIVSKITREDSIV